MSEARPNLLLLLSDQHTQKIAGCYGDPLVRTPNIDRLAAGGLTFDNRLLPLPDLPAQPHVDADGAASLGAGMLDKR